MQLSSLEENGKSFFLRTFLWATKTKWNTSTALQHICLVFFSASLELSCGLWQIKRQVKWLQFYYYSAPGCVPALWSRVRVVVISIGPPAGLDSIPPPHANMTHHVIGSMRGLHADWKCRLWKSPAFHLHWLWGDLSLTQGLRDFYGAFVLVYAAPKEGRLLGVVVDLVTAPQTLLLGPPLPLYLLWLRGCDDYVSRPVFSRCYYSPFVPALHCAAFWSPGHVWMSENGLTY